MSLEPDISELLARARADLRMGLPVVLAGGGTSILAIAAEALTAVRLEDLRALAGQLVVAITARRAATLKARVYDGDVARVILPDDANLNWLRAIADPADVHFVQVKCPLLTAERVADADTAGITGEVIGRNISLHF